MTLVKADPLTSPQPPARVQEFLHLEHGVVPLNVKEQRLSNLVQALLVGGCIAATQLVRRIPKSVLWGYFAYMAFESLPGSEFWDRLLLLATDRRKRCARLIARLIAPGRAPVPCARERLTCVCSAHHLTSCKSIRPA
jgi:HCO3- transporter family